MAARPGAHSEHSLRSCAALLAEMHGIRSKNRLRTEPRRGRKSALKRIKSLLSHARPAAVPCAAGAGRLSKGEPVCGLPDGATRLFACRGLDV